MRSASHSFGLTARLLAAAAVVALLGLGAAPAGAGPLPIEPLPIEPVPLPAPLGEPDVAPARQAGASQSLVGTFGLTAASCRGAVTGSYFRMIQPGGNSSGPFVQNGDSPCTDTTYTPMAPGSDGGLVTGSYQAQPDPAFDTTGGGKAARITKPQKFFGVDFASATNPKDPQTGVEVSAPKIEHDGTGKLQGDLRAFGASWNNQSFNQGAPKPDGSMPGETTAPTGTYEPTTGKFVLEWTSQIVGGPFNGFAGLWHFEGTFESSQSTPTSSPGTSAPESSGTGAAPSGASANAFSTGTESAAPSSSFDSSSSGSSGSTSGPLALTGPTFSSGPGLALLAAGAAGLAAVGRLRRRSMIGDAGHDV